MKKTYLLFILLLSFIGYAQEVDYGNNEDYTPFTNFAAPVAKPTSPDNPPAITGKIVNREANIETKSIQPANAGIHFQKGIKGAKTVRYDLFVTDTVVNYTGKERRAIAVNGSNPAPTLNFTVGDTALIYIHNKGKEPTSVHWHGVMLPNRMDGVPFLTQRPIPPNSTYVYKFPVVQSGTHLYHSHYGLQEQIGLTGALIFNKRTEPDIPTIPVVLADWTDTKPSEVYRMLRTGNDWFGIKKHSTQSYWEALKEGKIGAKFVNEWKRMEAMDISDVYYEQFHLNGDTTDVYDQFKAGDKVRLRIINGSASSYFWLNYSGGKIKVIANDGNDVTPVDVDRLLIAISETYDVIVTIPEDKQFEFRATAEDRSGYASLWLGNGDQVNAATLSKLKYFDGMKMMNKMMKMNGDMKASDMTMALQEMDMNAVMYPEVSNADHNHDTHQQKEDENGAHHSHHNKSDEHAEHHSDTNNHNEHKTHDIHAEHHSDDNNHNKHEGHDMQDKHNGHNQTMTDPVTLNYNMLESVKETALEETDEEWKELEFELTGNMNRYVWSLDNKTVGETDKILIRKGQNLRLIINNNSMMRHPMHLHGQDFRLLNKFGKKSPLKNVVDIMPMETDTLEFKASESGDWFFHCHVLYHMAGGMGRIFEVPEELDTVEFSQTKKDIRTLNAAERTFQINAQNDFAYNSNAGFLYLDNTNWGIKADWRLGYKDKDGYEATAKVGRYFGKMQWLFPYVGASWRYKRGLTRESQSWFGQSYRHDRRYAAQIGVQYTLPWLVVADASIDHYGRVLLEISREDIPLSNRLRGSIRFNSDKEARFGLNYIVFKNFGISGNYDTEFGWGAGIRATY